MLESFFKSKPSTQLLLAGGCAALLLCVYIFVLWLPLRANLQLAEAEQRDLQSSLVNMRNLVERFQQAEMRSEDNAFAADNLSLTAMVDQSLQSRSFQPSRIQQSSTGELQLRLDGVDFNDALGWINEMEVQAGIIVTNVTVNQAQTEGVNISLSLSQQ